MRRRQRIAFDGLKDLAEDFPRTAAPELDDATVQVWMFGKIGDFSCEPPFDLWPSRPVKGGLWRAGPDSHDSDFSRRSSWPHPIQQQLTNVDLELVYKVLGHP